MDADCDITPLQGFRVELDGVTAVLSAAPGVNMAVALLVEQELVAFVEPQEVCLDTVRAECGKLLPYYAVPTKVCALPQLPMTPYVFTESCCCLSRDN